MKFGHFDDQNKEYVITTPQTPLPWINYLGSEDFFSLVSNTAGGYSFYRDARLRRLTRYRYNSSPLDMDGHHIYIKDGDTVWNPGWQPTKTELDSYTCRHGLGYTILEGRKNGVTAQQELFVPKGDACELDRLTLRNDSGTEKELDVFSYVEFCLWDAVDDSSNFQRNFSTGEVEVEGSAVYHKTEYRERRDHYAVFWANCPISSFDTSRDAFCGVYGGPADPQAVRAGHCSGSIAHGWAPVGALHIHVKLAPGECRSILFGLGYIENPQEEKFVAPGVINKARAHAMMERYATDAQVDALLKTHFRPEFLNRIDEIVYYKPLTKEQISKIVLLMLDSLNKRLADRQLKVELTDAAMNAVIDQGFDPVYGARPLKRFIQSKIETLVAKHIIAADVKPGDTLTIDVNENGELYMRW